MKKFFNIQYDPKTNEVRPSFLVCSSDNIMIKGGQFYAIWCEERRQWSTNQIDLVNEIDRETLEYAEQCGGTPILMRYFDNMLWPKFLRYCSSMSDSFVPLNQSVVFNNTTKSSDLYSSFSLPYSCCNATPTNYNKLISLLFSNEDIEKIEWCIGCVLCGEISFVHKFLVMYGPPGSGKSSLIHIIENLFNFPNPSGSYVTVLDSQGIVDGKSDFGLEQFKDSPIVAIQHDAKLDNISNNSTLNSIVSHEPILINEKYKSKYPLSLNCLLILGTNSPVLITDSKSGLLRRLIDVHTQTKYVDGYEFDELVSLAKTELGAIANKCMNVYSSLGREYYARYRPIRMMAKTDTLYNFVQHNKHIYEKEDVVSLSKLYSDYKTYCEMYNIRYVLPIHKFREDMVDYFKEFHEEYGGSRNVYICFTGVKAPQVVSKKKSWCSNFAETKSEFDKDYGYLVAQYAKPSGTPEKSWASVDTTLSNLDTTQTHFVKLPKNHIVVDIDCDRLEEAMDICKRYTKSYAEFSKSGTGIHIHYTYDGDVKLLPKKLEPNVELKTFSGNAAIRRKLTCCLNNPIVNYIHKGGYIMQKIDEIRIKNETHLRNLIGKAIAKNIHPNTKPNVDYICKVLRDAKENGIYYDCRNIKQAAVIFASNSTNNAMLCVKLINEAPWYNHKESNVEQDLGMPITFFDIEISKNYFIICSKQEDVDGYGVMVNPTSDEVKDFVESHRLVGFNSRKFDNHLLWASMLGYSVPELYSVCDKIIHKKVGGLFGPAYGLTYGDIYDVTTKKQSLKKYQIELGIPHREIAFEEYIPVEKLDQVISYCKNDVYATEQVWKARRADVVGRLILSEMSGKPFSNTTLQHMTEIVFGDKKDDYQMVWKDLSKEFPGYLFENGKSHYRDFIVSEGGFVYSNPGRYENVTLLDVASLHPSSAIALEIWGPEFTPKVRSIVEMRIALKHKQFDTAKLMFDGKYAKYCTEELSSDLSYALKIIINSIYGYSSASFKNPFTCKENIDNVVAKRGALFMIDLYYKACDLCGKENVFHIKTDSIKIQNCSDENRIALQEFAKTYSYELEHEATYDWIILVDKANYIAKDSNGFHEKGSKFSNKYVLNEVFIKKEHDIKDYICVHETNKPMILGDEFIGKIGEFICVNNGKELKTEDGHYVQGTKGYLWTYYAPDKEYDINLQYYDDLVKTLQDEIDHVAYSFN